MQLTGGRVSLENSKQDTDIAAFLQFDAVQTAVTEDKVLEHPLLDQVARCSATPTDAIDFFFSMFLPMPEARITPHDAQIHDYILQMSGTLRALGDIQNASSSKGVPHSGKPHPYAMPSCVWMQGVRLSALLCPVCVSSCCNATSCLANLMFALHQLLLFHVVCS